jgi:hypothetical protein
LLDLWLEWFKYVFAGTNACARRQAKVSRRPILASQLTPNVMSAFYDNKGLAVSDPTSAMGSSKSVGSEETTSYIIASYEKAYYHNAYSKESIMWP